MKYKKTILSIVTMFFCITFLSGCTFLNNLAVKMNFRNDKFEYIKQNKVDKIIIQNYRDKGFRFIVNDTKAIDDIYSVLANGSIEEEKTILDPDYIFEIWIGDDVKKYNYVVGSESHFIGNFYDDENIFSVSKTLENTIMQNLSFIRKPRDFKYIYYNSIMKILDKKKDSLVNKKVGIDISRDANCLKYVFSVDLEEFKKNIKKIIPNCEIVDNNVEDFDVIVSSNNRGFSSTIFKTLIKVEDKTEKSLENYYISAEYIFRDWDILISDVNEKPDNW